MTPLVPTSASNEAVITGLDPVIHLRKAGMTVMNERTRHAGMIAFPDFASLIRATISLRFYHLALAERRVRHFPSDLQAPLRCNIGTPSLLAPAQEETIRLSVLGSHRLRPQHEAL
jgi:hypothetical protein